MQGSAVTSEMLARLLALLPLAAAVQAQVSLSSTLHGLRPLLNVWSAVSVAHVPH